MLNEKAAILPAFERNNVPVVLASSNMYAPYAGVLIQSLIDHASEKNNYDIIIFQHEISKENKRLLKSLADGHANVSIRICDSWQALASFGFNCEDVVNHWPIEVLCKIMAPHILECPGRMISIDIDTLLRTDIARLLDEDLGECSVGGVRDGGIIRAFSRGRTSYSFNMNIRDYFQDVCGFEADDIRNYINTGLLLFDRDKYIQELGIEAIWDAARQGRYIYLDQDILNVLMKGRIKILDSAWNLSAWSAWNDKPLETGSKICDEACDQSYEDPHLVHWAGKPNPWVCPDMPWGGEWWQTALRTPFVGHIIARMIDELGKRRAYYRERYGKDVDVWDPKPKGIDRT